MLDTIGRYRILQKIGSGSMGEVYRAHDQTLDREVALKAVGTGPTLDPDLKERFYREARLCARLQHANIVTVYDLGESDGYAYIAMELLHGRNLKQMIEGRELLSLSTKVEAIAQAAEGLAHAHRAGLVHRDLKPSNIFLTEAGQVKILDFGIARMPASMLTVAGLVLGTPNYMAPEQILGQPLDGRADLFSLAIVLFLWLTFEHPFRSDSIPKRIASQDPERLLDFAPEAESAMDAVMAKALARDPRNRYQTGDELAEALRQSVPAGETASTARAVAIVAPLSATGAMGDPVAAPSIPSANDDTLQPPPDADPAEWRIARFLEALQEFDEAYEVRAIGVARQALRIVETLASQDDRFLVAAAEYRSRLQDLEGVPERIAPAPVALPAEVSAVSPAINRAALPAAHPAEIFAPQSLPDETPKPTPEPAATIRQEVRSVDFSDATRMLTPSLLVGEMEASTPVPLSPVPVPAPLPSVPPEPMEQTAPQQSDALLAPSTAPVVDPVAADAAGLSRLYGTAQPGSPQLEAGTGANPPPQSSRKKPAMGGLAMKVLVAAAVIGGAVVLVEPAFRHGYYAVSTPFGTAEVADQRARLMSGSDGSGKIITELKKGDRVNILIYRPDLKSEWIPAQLIKKDRALEPGYVALSALTNWSRLAMVEAFRPGAAASADQRTRYLDQLKQFLKTAPPEDLERTRFAIQEQEATLVSKPAPVPETPPQVLPVPAEAAASASVADTVATTETTTPPVEQKDTPVETAYSAPLDFARANNAFENGEYQRAKRALGRILQHDPGNADAKSLLARVNAAQKVDPGIGK